MFKCCLKYTLPVIFCFLLVMASVAYASSSDEVIAKWEKSETFSESGGSNLTLRATYYSAEYIEAVVQKESEKNLWTKDEAENYKYQLLKSLQLDESIPLHIYIKNIGPGLHLAPFDSQLTLWVGNQKYKPEDYDKRFNFKISGEREGLIFFPRYDESGNSILEGVKSIRLVLYEGISPATMGKKVDFIWDVHKDDPSRLWSGDAAAKLEIDRLIKRINKLAQQKEELESQLAEVNEELFDINQRIDELRRQ